jgi:hypothetical protein
MDPYGRILGFLDRSKRCIYQNSLWISCFFLRAAWLSCHRHWFHNTDATTDFVTFIMFLFQHIVSRFPLNELFLGPNFFLKHTFSNICHLCSFLNNNRDQVSTWKTYCKLRACFFTFCQVETVIIESGFHVGSIIKSILHLAHYRYEFYCRSLGNLIANFWITKSQTNIML